MPFAVALLKLALFVMWAHPTYKMTVDMYERRERRLGILPKEEESPDEANGRTETGAAARKQTRKK
ncbi:MAG: hypothetical protein JJ959_19875 [Nisaea sp.]|jgi:hypothetical protein|uniref:hypothetical protein n=1 Tax=Nisaea sp. TaxID=2024842 RepID=UPI001B144445|nr:hypothetical protein [Nisaea sp.]MBO6562818.1 hypothetical protein [Nisaea sp.]